MKEVWRIIPSLPEYIASSYGRLMRLPYIGKMPYGGGRHYGGEPVMGIAHPRNGMRPTLYFNGKNYRVSRLVCEAFHGKSPFDGAVVMHIDDNPSNNRSNNLKWGTQKENLNSEAFIRYCKSRTGNNSPTVKNKNKRAAFLDAQH